MKIHVVQKGDTIQSIAELYGISVDNLIKDNNLTNPDHLSIGQTIVIAIPKNVYTIKEGDSLGSIAKNFNISLIELLANNPYLSERDYIYPGDKIIVSFDKKDIITTHGNTVPYIDKNTLVKTLPYLTYLSVLNYTATNEGNIITYYDDTEIIKTTKAFGVVPLMLLTTLTIHGDANIRTDFDLLLNEDFQDRQINMILDILNAKGYLGLNISFQYISVSNIELYEGYLTKISNRLNNEGFEVFVTVNPNITEMNNQIYFEKIDYSIINHIAQNIIFMSYEWAVNPNPPSPISSVNNLKLFLDYILKFIPSEKIIIGMATIGYDWELPYAPGISNVNSISYDRFLDFAYNYDAEIKFDEISQTPYFRFRDGMSIEHIVWFIDAKSINAILNLVSSYNLRGISVWNLTIYNPQLWLMINSQFEIEKII